MADQLKREEKKVAELEEEKIAITADADACKENFSRLFRELAMANGLSGLSQASTETSS